MATIKTRIQNKHDTSDNWVKAINFVPLKGEIIVYDDLGRIKIGDGVRSINYLPFADNMNLPPLMGHSTPANIWDICHLDCNATEEVLTGNQLCKFTVDNLILEYSSTSGIISAHNLGMQYPGILFTFPTEQIISVHVWGVCYQGSLENLNVANATLKNFVPTKFDIRWNYQDRNFAGSLDTVCSSQTDAYAGVVPFLSIPDTNSFCISPIGLEQTTPRSCIVNIEIYYPSSGDTEKDKTYIQIVSAPPQGSSDNNEVADDYTYNVHSGNISSFLSSAVSSAVSSNSSIVKTSGNQTIAGVKTFSSVPVCSTTPTSSNQLVNKSYVDGNFVSTGSSAQTITGIKTFAQTGQKAPIEITNDFGNNQTQSDLYIYADKLEHYYANGNYYETFNFPIYTNTDGGEYTLATTDDLIRSYGVYTRSTSSLGSSSYNSAWNAITVQQIQNSQFKIDRTVIFQISSGPYGTPSNNHNKSVFVWRIDSWSGTWNFHTETSASTSTSSIGIDGGVRLNISISNNQLIASVYGRNANSTPLKLEYWILGA